MNRKMILGMLAFILAGYPGPNAHAQSNDGGGLLVSPDGLSGSIQVYDGETIGIRHDDNGARHTRYYPCGLADGGLGFDGLKSRGYSTVTVAMDIAIRANGENQQGSGRDFWLEVNNNGNDVIVWEQIDYNITWDSFQKVRFTATVPISRFSNSSRFRFGFRQTRRLNTKRVMGVLVGWNEGTWHFNTADVTFQVGR